MSALTLAVKTSCAIVARHIEASLVAGVHLTRDVPDVWWLSDDDDSRLAIDAARDGAIVIGHSTTALGLRGQPAERGDPSFPPVGSEFLPLQQLVEKVCAAVAPEIALAELESTTDEGGDVLLAVGKRATWCAVPTGRGLRLLLAGFPRRAASTFEIEGHVPLFHALTRLFVDEVLAFAFKRRHGVVVRKRFGPFGAPLLAWQAHYEELGGLENHALESFVQRLANSRQCASVSLIRRPFRWKRRTPGLVAFDANEPVTQPHGAAFHSGHWVRRHDRAELGFPSDPRVVEYYQPTPGQRGLTAAPLRGGRLVVAGQSRLESWRVVLDDGWPALEFVEPIRGEDGRALEFASPAVTTSPEASGPQRMIVSDGGHCVALEETPRGWKTLRTFDCEPGTPHLCRHGGELALLIGTADGRVMSLSDVFAAPTVPEPRVVFETGLPDVAPWKLADGSFVLGDGAGRVWRWNGSLTPFASSGASVLRSASPYVQQAAAPCFIEAGGRQWLLVGAALVAHHVSLENEAATGHVFEALHRLAPGRPQISAHVALGQAQTLSEVELELTRHRDTFERFGLRWPGNGCDQHCWWLPADCAASALLAERRSGLCFNFGWQPPRLEAAPEGSAEFALAFPFFLREGARDVDFVLHNPVLPSAHLGAQDLMTELGLPCVFFTHAEYRGEGAGADELDSFVANIESRRKKRGAVFTTTLQMARSIAVTLGARVSISRVGDSVTVAVNVDAVPRWAESLLSTFAVSVDGRCRTVGSAGTTLSLTAPAADPPLLGASGPVTIRDRELHVEHDGFQELIVSGAHHLEWPGAHRREMGAAASYTRFGEAAVARWSSPFAPLKRTWHAQHSRRDEWVVNELWAGRPPSGYFVDIGAADGETGSATLALEELGWSGICVEPNAHFFSRLARRRRCRVENACVGERNGTTRFIEASWFGRIHTHSVDDCPDGDFSKNPYFTHDADGSAARLSEKAVVTLETLLEKHRAPRRIQFLSVSAEFSEWWILKDFPFDRWEIEAICTRTKFRYGDQLYDGRHAETLRRHLRSLGYFHDRERSRAVEHDFFVHPRLVAPPVEAPLLSVPAPWRRHIARLRRSVGALAAFARRLRRSAFDEPAHSPLDTA